VIIDGIEAGNMSDPLTLGESGLDAATGILTAVPLALVLCADFGAHDLGRVKGLASAANIVC
jgi:hypothetical protein